MTILILGYFYPKTWVVRITGKATQRFGLFSLTGFYSVAGGVGPCPNVDHLGR